MIPTARRILLHIIKGHTPHKNAAHGLNRGLWFFIQKKVLSDYPLQRYLYSVFILSPQPVFLVLDWLLCFAGCFSASVNGIPTLKPQPEELDSRLATLVLLPDTVEIVCLPKLPIPE